MHNMEAKLRVLSSNLEDQLERRDLPSRRSRLDERLVMTRIGDVGRVHMNIHFGMEKNQGVRTLQYQQSSPMV